MPNQFEQAAGLRAAREAFRTFVAGRAEVVNIDGTRPADHVHRQVVAHLVDGPLKARHCAKSYGCDDPALCSYARSDTCRWYRIARLAYRQSQTA